MPRHPATGDNRRRLTAAERRASILAAASQVFSELGYERGTMSEVARRVGVSEPVVFQNFGSKAAVFVAVLEHAAQRVSARFHERAAAKGSIGAWVQELLAPEHLGRLHERGSHGALFAEAMLLTAEPEIRGAARRAHRTIAATLAALLERGQQEGSIRRDVDPEASAWWILSLLASYGFRTATMPHRRRLEAELGAMTLGMLTEPARLSPLPRAARDAPA